MTPEPENMAATTNAPVVAGAGAGGERPAKQGFQSLPSGRAWRLTAICISLVVLVIAVFGQTANFGFIDRDDPDYVYHNPVVQKGLSLSSIEWAFTHSVSAHWHPLTVILFMTEYQCFGMWPGGYHLVNVLLHAAAVVLLFLLLLELTGVLWRSAFVAAVFAIHPLRAESVAWIAECKDVLSGVFFMLTLWAYVRYVRRPKSKGRYAIILLWFALGLMSKAMVVTVPFVLLLLDYWPLARLRSPADLPRLLFEKAPLFILCLLSSMVAVFANASNASSHPANAPVAGIAYIRMLLFPVGLAPGYPIPDGGVPSWELFNSILLLAALTTVAWFLRRAQPWLVMGWLWYLGMLLPVSGILQTSNTEYADRYTYLPQIGLCIAGTWMIADWAKLWRHGRTILGIAAAAVTVVLAIGGWRQTSYWRDNVTYWTRSLKYIQHNVTAATDAAGGLGDALFQRGQTQEAMAVFRTIQDAGFLDGLGAAAASNGKMEEAVALYRLSLQLDFTSARTYNNLGDALYQQGHFDQALLEFRQAVRFEPSYAIAFNNMGNTLIELGRAGEAVDALRRAVALDSSTVEVHNNLGNALLQLGRTDEAITECREALKIDPNYANAHANLGNALFRGGGDIEEAISECRTALRIAPANTGIQNILAWILATAPGQNFRNGPEAVQLAASASVSTGGHDPGILRTLAAAYAQTGDFSDALKTAQGALQLATSQSNPTLANVISADIKLYQAGFTIEDGR